jgi:hypothetical protein
MCADEDGIVGEDVEPHRWHHRHALYASMAHERKKLVREFRSRRPRRAAQGIRLRASRVAGAEGGDKTAPNPAGACGQANNAVVRPEVATSRLPAPRDDLRRGQRTASHTFSDAEVGQRLPSKPRNRFRAASARDAQSPSTVRRAPTPR